MKYAYLKLRKIAEMLLDEEPQEQIILEEPNKKEDLSKEDYLNIIIDAIDAQDLFKAAFPFEYNLIPQKEFFDKLLSYYIKDELGLDGVAGFDMESGILSFLSDHRNKEILKHLLSKEDFKEDLSKKWRDFPLEKQEELEEAKKELEARGEKIDESELHDILEEFQSETIITGGSSEKVFRNALLYAASPFLKQFTSSDIPAELISKVDLSIMLLMLLEYDKYYSLFRNHFKRFFATSRKELEQISESLEGSEKEKFNEILARVDFLAEARRK